MDPDATLVALLDACVEARQTPASYPREEFLEALDNLRGWVKGGGFLPNVDQIDAHNTTINCGSYRIGKK